MPRRRFGPLHPRQLAALLSPAYAAQRAAGLRRANEVNRTRPKCGAKKRTDGGACTQPVAEAGLRCRYHGGATPRGDAWHRIKLPPRGAALARLEKKLREIERRQVRQKARVASMTSAERARYDEWQRNHKPGPAVDREHARRSREARALFAKNTPKAVTDAARQARRLAAVLVELRARLAALTSPPTTEATPHDEA